MSQPSYQIYTPSDSDGIHQVLQSPSGHEILSSPDMSFENIGQHVRREREIHQDSGMKSSVMSRPTPSKKDHIDKSQTSFGSEYFVFSQYPQYEQQQKIETQGIADQMAQSMTPISKKQSSIYIADNTGDLIAVSRENSRLKVTTSRDLSSNA